MLLTGLKLAADEAPEEMVDDNGNDEDKDEDKDNENVNGFFNDIDRGQDQGQIPQQLCLDNIRFTLVNGEEFSSAESICLTLSDDSDLITYTAMLQTKFIEPAQGQTGDGFVVGQSNTQEEFEEALNITDVIATVNLILDGQYNEFYDLNSDGALAVTDVTALINSILGN